MVLDSILSDATQFCVTLISVALACVKKGVRESRAHPLLAAAADCGLGYYTRVENGCFQAPPPFPPVSLDSPAIT